MQTAWYDTVATLGWLAALTTEVRLLSHVFIPAYRHPLVTAKSFMTLDHLSGGRAILGVGAGHVEGEFDVLGIPFAERGGITDDAVDVIRAAFDDEFPDIDTERWSVHGVGQSPRPTQAHLPIWVGGSSRPALRRAAERGDGWLPQGPPPRAWSRPSRSSRSDGPSWAGPSPSTSVALPCPCTSGPPTGTSDRTPCRDRPISWPSSSAAGRRQVSRTFRFACAAAAPTSWSTRSRPSGPR